METVARPNFGSQQKRGGDPRPAHAAAQLRGGDGAARRPAPNNKSFDKVSEFLRPEHFADERHGRIYDACAKLIQRGQIANPVTLKNLLRAGRRALARSAGRSISRGWSARSSPSSMPTTTGALIHDLYLRRQLIAIGEDIVNAAYELRPRDGRIAADRNRPSRGSSTSQRPANTAAASQTSPKR